MSPRPKPTVTAVDTFLTGRPILPILSYVRNNFRINLFSKDKPSFSLQNKIWRNWISARRKLDSKRPSIILGFIAPMRGEYYVCII